MTISHDLVITTYNSYAYIDTIKSTLSSESRLYDNLLIVDDSSDLPFLEILADISSPFPNVTLISHSTNRGVSAARNTGIKHSCSEYISFVDCDDSFLPGKTTIVNAALAEYQPNILFVAPLRGSPIQSLCSSPVLHKSSLYLFKSIYFTPCFTARRNFLLHSSGLYNERLRYAEDIELYIRIRSVSDVLYISKPLVSISFSRAHRNSLSSNQLRMRVAMSKIFLSNFLSTSNPVYLIALLFNWFKYLCTCFRGLLSSYRYPLSLPPASGNISNL